jgi:biotin synthase-related radical SAM superfamily protein
MKTMPKTLKQIESEQLLRFKAQITRLAESVNRLKVYSALQMDHRALQDELKFTSQVVEAMQKQNIRFHAFTPSDLHADTCCICGKIDIYRWHIKEAS